MNLILRTISRCIYDSAALSPCEACQTHVRGTFQQLPGAERKVEAATSAWNWAPLSGDGGACLRGAFAENVFFLDLKMCSAKSRGEKQITTRRALTSIRMRQSKILATTQLPIIRIYAFAFASCRGLRFVFRGSTIEPALTTYHQGFRRCSNQPRHPQQHPNPGTLPNRTGVGRLADPTSDREKRNGHNGRKGGHRCTRKDRKKKGPWLPITLRQIFLHPAIAFHSETPFSPPASIWLRPRKKNENMSSSDTFLLKPTRV